MPSPFSKETSAGVARVSRNRRQSRDRSRRSAGSRCLLPWCPWRRRRRCLAAALLSGWLAAPMVAMAQLGVVVPTAEETDTEGGTSPRKVQIAQSRVIGRSQRAFDPLQPGSRSLGAEEIDGLRDASYDPNELLEILPNVQFDNRRFRLGPNDLGDLSPAEVSISGARPGENNFVINGVGTNSLLDSLSQRAFDQVEASSQSVFLDSDLIGELTVYDSNVPAEYGDFLGGVVRADLRDPAYTFRAALKVDYAADALTSSILDFDRLDYDPAVDGPLPEPTKFQRLRWGATVDVPVRQGVRTLLSYSRQEAEVTRNALSSSYFSERRTRSTVRENFLAKAQVDVGDLHTLNLQILLTPYEDQYWRTDLNRQFGGGSTSQVEWNTDLDQTAYQARLALTTTDNRRKESRDHYIYLRTPGVENTLRGGFGDFDQSQTTWELALKATRDFDDWDGRWTVGLQARRSQAERARPETTFGYRGGFDLTRFPFPVTVATANPADDLTFIPGEQVLLERNDYRAFSAEAVIHDVALYSDYRQTIIVLSWLTLVPSVGLRGTYDDFLGNLNLAPRLNLTLQLPLDLALNVGFNRYYAKNQLLYALREQDPDNFVFRRNDPFTDLTIGDWQLSRQTRSSSFSSSDLDTPYSDEVVASAAAPIWKLGEFRVKGLLRFARDGFARSEPITETRINELGNPFTFRRFELTNDGRGEYRSVSLEWAKTYRNSTLSISSTWAENVIAPGTDTLLSNTEPGRENEAVLLRRLSGENSILRYNQLGIERENFNVPAYVAFSWLANWFDGRLTTGIRGRFRPAFTTIVDLDTDTTLNGQTFATYEEQDLPTQTIFDGTLSYRLKLVQRGVLEMRVAVDNLFNTTPNVEVTPRQPYQQGRTFSLGATLSF